MLNVYSANVTATADMTVPLNTKAIQRGYSAILASNSTDIAFNLAGIYEVAVSAYGTTTADGVFGFALNGDGSNIIARAASETNVAAGELGAVSFTTLIAANNADSGTAGTVSLTYTGNAGTINLVNVVVKKVA